VHGLTGSAVNWSDIAPRLTQRYRLLAPDLSGHGLTWSARRGSGVPANRVLLDGFLAALATGPAILMGNSMGGMISLLEAVAAPKAVAGLILIDPALPLAGTPGVQGSDGSGSAGPFAAGPSGAASASERGAPFPQYNP